MVAAASAADLATALRNFAFQPTPTFSGPDTRTIFSLTVTDAANASSAVDMATVVPVTHGTDRALRVSGLTSPGTAPPAAPGTLARGILVADQDANPSVLSARVAITSGCMQGEFDRRSGLG